MVLPRYVALQSSYNGLYLGCVEDEGEIKSFLKFGTEQIINPQAKMAVERAKSGDGLVHLRCCYNNKYWQRRSSGQRWILASATETEEDQSKWSCTLFKPVLSDDNTVHFMHVQNGLYVYAGYTGDAHNDCLYAGGTSSSEASACRFVDWESLVILPKYVAFKNSDGKYLAFDSYVPHFCLTDVADRYAEAEIFTHNDGSISIKPIYSNGFLTHRDDNKWVHSDPGDKFWPVKLHKNTLALRHMPSNTFCREYDDDKRLIIWSPSIIKEAQFGVEELVISREIYDVTFRLSDARIYQQSVLVMATGNASNMTSQPNEEEITLSYKKTSSSKWNASVSLKLGVETTIKTGIPFIAEGEIDISTEFTGSYEWGKDTGGEEDLETKYKVTVPPMTQVTVNLLATKGSCDVPFSYCERDSRLDGRQTTVVKDDGMYTGVNCYNFYYETREKKL